MTTDRVRSNRARCWRMATHMAGFMLLTGCGGESNHRDPRAAAPSADSRRVAALQPCSDPALQPIERTSGAAVAVNYPASELQRPTRLARPFPLTDPRSPLPFITIPRPAIRGVRAAPGPTRGRPDLGGRPPAAISTVEPLPPIGISSVDIEPLPPVYGDTATVEPLPPVDVPAEDAVPLPEVETLPKVEPLPEIEPLPEVGPLPDVELPGELPMDAKPMSQSGSITRPEAAGPATETDVPGSSSAEEVPLALPAPATGDSVVAPAADGIPARRESPFRTDIESGLPDPRPPTPDPYPSPRPPTIAPRPSPRLLTPGPSPDRTSSMDAVAGQAQRMIQHGYELGGRGALFSARAEFISALRTMAQALDAQSGNRQHSEALSAGLKALEEAEHFVPQGSRLEADLDLGAMVRAHRTPVCKDLPEDQLLPVLVLQRYYTYAQEQLTAAGGGEEAASMALFGLGKTYTALAGQQAPSIVAAEPKAMVFHQAALSTDPGNFLAANELAVLVAGYGQYSTARALLQYSIAILPHSSVWKNLAAVHERLGEVQLAQAAQREATAAARREATAKLGNRDGIIPSSEITWVDPSKFAGMSRPTIEWQKPATVNAAEAKPAPADRSARKGWSGWWK